MKTCGDNGGVTANGDPCKRTVDEGLCYQHAEGDDGSGRPPYEPTDKERGFVEAAAMGGIPQKRIAAAIGISDKTLAKHFRHELDHGMDEANAQVVRTAFEQAVSGESPAMTMFWLKTRMGWKETQRHEVEAESIIIDLTNGADDASD